MLSMAALQQCDPIFILILNESDNCSLHFFDKKAEPETAATTTSICRVNTAEFRSSQASHGPFRESCKLVADRVGFQSNTFLFSAPSFGAGADGVIRASENLIGIANAGLPFTLSTSPRALTCGLSRTSSGA